MLLYGNGVPHLGHSLQIDLGQRDSLPFRHLRLNVSPRVHNHGVPEALTQALVLVAAHLAMRSPLGENKTEVL